MIVDYLKLAIGNLTRRKLRSWLTLIGIFIGIAAVVSLIGLGEGLRNAISSQFSMLGTDVITVQASGVQFGPPGTGVVNPLKDDYVDKIEKVNGVTLAINRVIKTAKAEFNKRASIVYIGSMPDGEKRKEIEGRLGMKPIEGRLLKDGEIGKVYLGNEFKKTDSFGKAISAGDKLIIQGKAFEVVGIGKKTGSFTTDLAILMNDDDVWDLYGNKNDVSMIIVKVNKDADMNRIQQDIEKILRKERDVKEGEEDFTVELSINAIKTLESTLFAVQLFVYIIAGISLVVGGIGIMNTMFTAVVERTKEIGILKSIGARNSDIFMIFLVESGMLGSVGGIIGMSIGVALAEGLAFLGGIYLSSDLIKASLPWWLIVGSLSFSFIVGCIAGITPAVRASSLHPVDALRKD
jgi:putative ABC transport system permease protein